MKFKSTSFLFCFHPKFDTGTWSIAVAFATLVMFSAIFTMALSYSAPTCICPQIFDHLGVLPTEFKVIYVFLLLFLLAIVASSILAIYGTFKAQHSKLSYYVILMIVTELGTIGGSIFGLIQIARFEEYLLFDNETYWNMAKMVLKEELVTQLENVMETVTALLKTTLAFDMSQALNMDTLMDATLKDEVLVVLGGMKMMMKVSAILLIIGINTLFITSIMIVGSHYRRLKEGILRTYTGVPGLVIHKAVLTNSGRSTASDSLSDDWSGTPLRKLQQMKSKDYASSTRSSRRLYNTDKLSVEEKFPKGDFL